MTKQNVNYVLLTAATWNLYMTSLEQLMLKWRIPSGLWNTKITHMWRRWGTPQNFVLTFLDELEKQLFIKRTVEVGQYFTTVYQNHHMIYSFWDIERDGMKWVILGHFSLFYLPKNQKKKNRILKKLKKLLETSFYTYVTKLKIMWCTVPEIRSETKILFLSFWAIFSPFTP